MKRAVLLGVLVLVGVVTVVFSVWLGLALVTIVRPQLLTGMRRKRARIETPND